ncbi:hypothetical protein [Altererythrobacter sp. Z27]|uniref:hypothetical protein n=1 Tax=Altererythrobacter sp. Z27 TaxID=3461147 RepID=UPI004043F42A
MPDDVNDKSQSRIKLKIVSATGEEWFQEASSVPRVGDRCSVWTDANRIAWSGPVESVNWCYAKDFDGTFVIVQLAPNEAI